MGRWLCCVVLALAGCVADADDAEDGGADDAATMDAAVTDAAVTDAMATDATPGPVPARHRAMAEMCDDERSDQSYDPDPDFGGCTEHAECVDGPNGRCVGNGHDGWYCTYDECFADADCDNVCECGGGFRSDHNVCVIGDCRTDADCGPGGFCSPSLGDCGHYTGFVGYWCHTPEDECLDDADCAGTGEFGEPYCAFTGERWTCSDAECVGK